MDRALRAKAHFTVRLPLAASTSTVADHAGPIPAPAERISDFRALSGVRVLVVEDDADTRDLLQRLLEANGAEVCVAVSAGEALGLLERDDPDILVCDIGMPDVDGYEFIKIVRRSRNSIPSVALTAFARSQDRTRAVLAGYQSHQSKPVEPLELLSTIEALAKRQRRRPAPASSARART